MKLSPLTRQDCEKVRQWRNDDLAFLRTPYFLTEEMQSNFYDTVINNRDSKHRYFAVISDPILYFSGEERMLSDSKFIGMVGLTNIEWENGCAEISIILDPDARGMGYGMKAVDLVLSHAFEFMRLNMVYGEVYHCGNEAFWRKVVDRYNGHYTTLQARKFYDGIFWDSTYFSITAEQWGES